MFQVLNKKLCVVLGLLAAFLIFYAHFTSRAQQRALPIPVLETCHNVDLEESFVEGRDHQYCVTGPEDPNEPLYKAAAAECLAGKTILIVGHSISRHWWV
jgi:hypothetical protein